jgi:hypothetical protein
MLARRSGEAAKVVEDEAEFVPSLPAPVAHKTDRARSAAARLCSAA